MELRQAILRRRMVRAYAPDQKPTAAQITELLGLAIRAPSAGFSQGWHFLVLDEPAALTLFWDAASDSSAPADGWLNGMKTASVLILALSEPTTYLSRYAEPDKGWTDQDKARWPVPYWDIDTGMASLLILLGAVDLGLASCFFGVPTEATARVKQAFGIPVENNIVGVISVGYPAADRRSPSLTRGRKSVAEVSSWNRFGEPTSDEFHVKPDQPT